ncbi:group IID secretory phospholipase A2 [Alligator mississippiensis]|uniref:Phospholipase A2 n=2 Tax=Alligator mississippiensis TaxID=8496 RepID=A0A151MJ37_ALLMI|nr:group IID secretory phospholipase A2 [Alligator mississippiensis]
MRNLHIFALLGACSLLEVNGSVLEYQKMIKQVTGKGAILSYYGYGCYCGSKGKGEPKDATDWCCHIHNCCYKRLKESNCHGNTKRYDYAYKNGNIICALGSWCEEQVCACDRNAVFCLEKNLDTYNSRFVRYRDSKCTGSTPECYRGCLSPCQSFNRAFN